MSPSRNTEKNIFLETCDSPKKNVPKIKKNNVETQIETVAVIEGFHRPKKYVVGQFLVGFFRGNGKVKPPSGQAKKSQNHRQSLEKAMRNTRTVHRIHSAYDVATR